MLLMLVFWLLLIGGAGALVVWVVRRLATYPRGGQPPFAPPDEALEVLRQRYAKGEISREEYERIRQDLSG
jgi:putative membrane protein